MNSSPPWIWRANILSGFRDEVPEVQRVSNLIKVIPPCQASKPGSLSLNLAYNTHYKNTEYHCSIPLSSTLSTGVCAGWWGHSDALAQTFAQNKLTSGENASI